MASDRGGGFADRKFNDLFIGMATTAIIGMATTMAWPYRCYYWYGQWPYRPYRLLRRWSEAQRRVVIPTRTEKHMDVGRLQSENVWNRLPDNLRTITTLLTFKSKLKTHLFSTAFCV